MKSVSGDNRGFRITALSLLFLLSACGKPSAPVQVEIFPSDPVQASIKRAQHWLLTQQAADGGWHSATYGSLRSGVGTTALILEAFAQGDLEPNSETWHACRRGLEFLSAKTDSFGLVCSPDGRGDSTVYATALLLTASDRIQPLPADRRRLLVAALLKAQQIPANGWPEEASGRGGWGVEADPATAESNAANLSVTAHVLRALHAEPAFSSEAKTAVIEFLDRCRASDMSRVGGFWFTPKVTDHLNKAGWFINEGGEPEAKPYHVATCDGMIAFQQLGLSEERQKVHAAQVSLAQLPLPELPTRALEADEIAPPLAGLFFYDAAALARACQEIEDPLLNGQRIKIEKQLLDAQHPDGSWSNPIAWMREDDPLVATALAVIALQQSPQAEEN